MNTKDAKNTQDEQPRKKLPFRHSLPTSVVRLKDGRRYLKQGDRYYTYAEYDRVKKKYLPYPYEVDIKERTYTNEELVQVILSCVSEINKNLTKLNNLVAYIAKKQRGD